MRSSLANVVPPEAWLAPGYAEWPAPAGLRGAVACLWLRVVPEGGGGSLVLPDACSDLIWEQGTGCFVAGPDTGPARHAVPAGTVFVGARFRPAAGGQVLGLPLRDLHDQRVPLGDLSLAENRRVPATLEVAEAARRILGITGRLVAASAPDPAVTRAAALLRDPRARIEDVAQTVGLSVRHLRRRCHAAAGYGPKTLQRVLRFQRFVQMLDAAGAASVPHGPGARLDLAAAASLAGYADQAHLTRECVTFSGLTPVVLNEKRHI